MSPHRQRHLVCFLLTMFVLGVLNFSVLNYVVRSRSSPTAPLPTQAHQRHERNFQASPQPHPTLPPATSNKTSTCKHVILDQDVCIDTIDKDEAFNSQQCTNEAQVFSSDRPFDQEDPLLTAWVRRKLLEVPNLAPYNLTPFKKQIGREEFQTRQYAIIQRLLGNKRNGVFVEAGANDGEYLSNTIKLETTFGWSGLLVEPDPTAYSKLKQKNRKAFSANVCLSPTGRMQKMKFTVNRQMSVLSKLTDFAYREIGSDWLEKDVQTIPCVPLYTLVASAGITQIDFLSLDIEGAELEVLETIPFDKIPILTMTVEYDKIADDPVKDARLQKLMKDNGFLLIEKYTVPQAADYVYAHKSLFESSQGSAG